MKKRSFYSLALAVVAAVFTASCEKDDNQNTSQGSYVLHVRAEGANNESTDYMTTASTLDEGSVSIEGRGIEQLGWRYSYGHNNSVFSIGYGDNYMIGYRMNESGVLAEAGKLSFEKTLDCAGDVDENTIVAIQADRAAQGRVIHIINTESIAVESKVSTDFGNFAGDSLAVWPTGIQYRDGKLFVSAYPLLPDGKFTTPSVDTAYVAVLSYPDMTVEKVLKDTRTSPVGVYGADDGMIQTEAGDIYTLSTSSAAGGYTKVTKPSGVLRINSGEMDFDSEYFFNFEAETNGEKLVHWAYVGNGKALVQASTLTNETPDDLWASYVVTNPIMKLYIMDLEAQTLQEVGNVPLHGGTYGFPHLIKNGKVFINVTTPDEGAYIYEIDPATATGVKGTKVEAVQAAGIYKLD